MKKQNKKNLLKIILILIVIFVIGVFIIKTSGLGSTSSVGGKLSDINSNTITFDSGFLQNYDHVMLESTDSKNIEDGLEFDIINPKGEKVTSGRLHDNQIFKARYNSMAGEWKIILHFKDDSSSSMINFGFALSSEKENSMRVE
jgi:hypothetical protein